MEDSKVIELLNSILWKLDMKKYDSTYIGHRYFNSAIEEAKEIIENEKEKIKGN